MYNTWLDLNLCEFVWGILEFFCMLVKFIPSSGPRRGFGSLTEYFRKKKSHAHLRNLTIICSCLFVISWCFAIFTNKQKENCNAQHWKDLVNSKGNWSNEISKIEQSPLNLICNCMRKRTNVKLVQGRS